MTTKHYQQPLSAANPRLTLRGRAFTLRAFGGFDRFLRWAEVRAEKVPGEAVNRRLQLVASPRGKPERTRRRANGHTLAGGRKWSVERTSRRSLSVSPRLLHWPPRRPGLRRRRQRVAPTPTPTATCTRTATPDPSYGVPEAKIVPRNTATARVAIAPLRR